MGLGWVIGGVPHSKYISAASDNSNNVAEYLALIEVLQAALKLPEVTTLKVYGDSQLVSSQLSGEYAVRSPNIIPHFQQAASLIAKLKKRGCQVSVQWHPRECNEAADAASKKALTDNDVLIAERKSPAGFTKRLGDIGVRLSLSAVAVGKMLDRAGLRTDDKKPTELALIEGVARERFDGFGPVTDWHIEKVLEVASLDAAEEAKRKPPMKLGVDHRRRTGTA